MRFADETKGIASAVRRVALAIALLASLGGVPCATASTIYFVAIMVTAPGSADESTLVARQGLEALARSTLSAIPGISIVESGPRQVGPPGAPTNLEDWARSQAIVFLVKAEMIPVSSGKEWAVTWWLADLRNSRDQPLPYWPKLTGPAGKLNHAAMHVGMGRIVADIQEKLGTLVPQAKRRKNVLVSCFSVTKGEPSPNEVKLLGATSRLSTRLPNLLNAKWKLRGNDDFGGLALHDSDVRRLCEKLESPQQLADHKGQADYVIEGQMWTSSAEEITVRFSVFVQNTIKPLGQFDVPCGLDDMDARVADSVEANLSLLLEGK